MTDTTDGDAPGLRSGQALRERLVELKADVLKQLQADVPGVDAGLLRIAADVITVLRALDEAEAEDTAP